MKGAVRGVGEDGFTFLAADEAEDSLLMSALKEKPIQLLGRLVFEKNIRPEK